MIDLFKTLSTKGLLHSCSLTQNGQMIDFSEALRQQLGYAKHVNALRLKDVVMQESLKKIQQLFFNPPVTEQVQRHKTHHRT